MSVLSNFNEITDYKGFNIAVDNVFSGSIHVPAGTLFSQARRYVDITIPSGFYFIVPQFKSPQAISPNSVYGESLEFPPIPGASSSAWISVCRRISQNTFRVEFNISWSTQEASYVTPAPYDIYFKLVLLRYSRS